MAFHYMNRVLLLIAVGSFAVACGIPEKKYRASLDRIKKLDGELVANKKAADAREKELKEKNASLQGENKTMKVKLVAMGQDLEEIKTESGRLVADIDAKQKRITSLIKAQEAARKRAQIYQQLLARFKQMIDSGKLKVNFRKGRMIVQLNDKILFAPGKATLKEEGQAALEEVSAVLSSIPGRNFQVAGHTDDRPVRSRRVKSNWHLSASRAVNVVVFMIQKGFDPKRISAAGYGAFDPVGDNLTKEGRALNRRIEITLVPSIAEIPGLKTP